MNVSVQLRLVPNIDETELLTTGAIEPAHDVQARPGDLQLLAEIAKSYNVPIWHVLSVATKRLHQDLLEHEKELSMGI